jgi:hypothetical protein
MTRIDFLSLHRAKRGEGVARPRQVGCFRESGA